MFSSLYSCSIRELCAGREDEGKKKRERERERAIISIDVSFVVVNWSTVRFASYLRQYADERTCNIVFSAPHKCACGRVYRRADAEFFRRDTLSQLKSVGILVYGSPCAHGVLRGRRRCSDRALHAAAEADAAENSRPRERRVRRQAEQRPRPLGSRVAVEAIPNSGLRAPI